MFTVALGVFTAALAAACASYNIRQFRQGPGGTRRHTAVRSLSLQVVGVIVGVLIAVTGYGHGLGSWLDPITWALLAVQVFWLIRWRTSHA